MEPDRFDDVELRVVESPEPPPRPPRRRRHRRLAFALGVAAFTAGAMAAGASALTDTAQAPASKKVSRSAEKSFRAGDCPFKHRSASGFDDSARY
jgi:anti-sigma factor RsiW